MGNGAEFLGESFCPELKDWQTRGLPRQQFYGFLPLLPGGCETEKQVFSYRLDHPPLTFLLNLKQSCNLIIQLYILILVSCGKFISVDFPSIQ